MKLMKSLMARTEISGLAEEACAERQLALEYIAECWNDAEDDGVTEDALAHASLFAALAALVEQHGETATAALIETLPERIRSGDYNLYRNLQ